MRKLINLLLLLTILYFGIEISFVNLNKGHKIEYKIKSNDKTFIIKEIYTQKRRHEKNNYYFEIKVDDTVFNYQTYKNYKRANYIIKKINYFEKSNYKCINLKDKKNLDISDTICMKDNIQYFYNSIKGKNKDVDNFVSKINNRVKYTDSKKNKIDADPVILYTDNLVDKHYIGLQNYKGIYLVNKKDKVKNINIFKNDVYTNKASIISNRLYLTIDYSKDYRFHNFYIVDIKNGKKKTITADDSISLDSYMQGSVNHEVFLFDRSNKLQYRINLKNKTVKVSGKVSSGIQVYRNNKFEIGSAYDALNNDLRFNIYSSDNKFNDKEYSRVDKVGNKYSGYYYLYVKNKDNYDVYRVNVQNKKVLTYIFTTDDINNVYYFEDYVYYKQGNYIKYYQNDLGIKTLLKNKEFEFNKSLMFGLYVK